MMTAALVWTASLLIVAVLAVASVAHTDRVRA